MDTSTPAGLITVAEYLEGDTESPPRQEYVNGRVFLREESINLHTRIACNAIGCFGIQLRGKPGRAHGSETKIRIPLTASTRFYHPDAGVVLLPNGGDEFFHDRPVLLLEVLSPGTRRIDEGEKRDAYLASSSVQLYLRVEMNQPLVTLDRRREDGFGFGREVHEGLEAVIPLPEIGIELPLRELYED